MPTELKTGPGRFPDPEVYKKYLANLKRGRKAFYNGQYNPFRGDLPSRISNGITLRSYYSEETDQAIRARFIDPVERSAEKNGVFLYPGYLWRLHATISNLIYVPGVTPTSYAETLLEVLADQRVVKAAQELCGQEVEYDFLFEGNTIALAASCLPEQVVEARRQFTQVAKDLELEETDYTNIYHTTLARIVGVHPQALQAGGLATFGREIMGLHYEVFNQSLLARIEKVMIIADTQKSITHGNILPNIVADTVAQRMSGTFFSMS